MLTSMMKKAMGAKKKYFLEEEFWETVSSTRIYDPKAELVEKEHIYKCSGARYSGQWLGGFRHGKGTMKWKDGATYTGTWEMGRAYGSGVFTHTKGEVY